MKRADASKIQKEELERQDEVDLERLWLDAQVVHPLTNLPYTYGHELTRRQARFQKLTNINLANHTLKGAIEQQIHAISQIDKPEKEGPEESEHYDVLSKEFFKNAFRRARDLFAKVFQVIWRFADFLMPIAEKIPIVGAGVTFLHKAIDLLITATKDYHSIFIKAAELFEQVGFFSMRFEMLMEAENEGVKMNHRFVSDKASIDKCHTKSIMQDWIPAPHHGAHCRLCSTLHSPY